MYGVSSTYHELLKIIPNNAIDLTGIFRRSFIFVQEFQWVITNTQYQYYKLRISNLVYITRTIQITRRQHAAIITDMIKVYLY